MPRPPGARTDYLYLPRPGMRPPKLTPAQRFDIAQRLADGEDPRDLATEYGVTASAIRRYR